MLFLRNGWWYWIFFKSVIVHKRTFLLVCVYALHLKKQSGSTQGISLIPSLSAVIENVSGNSLFGCLLPKPYWSVGVFFFFFFFFFLPNSPKSLSLHQFILICLLLKPGTRHVLFPGCRSLSAGFLYILPRWASPGWQEAFHIESSVIEFPHTPLIFSPPPHSFHLFFPPLFHPLLTKHSFNDCGITGHPFTASLWTRL